LLRRSTDSADACFTVPGFHLTMRPSTNPFLLARRDRIRGKIRLQAGGGERGLSFVWLRFVGDPHRAVFVVGGNSPWPLRRPRHRQFRRALSAHDDLQPRNHKRPNTSKLWKLRARHLRGSLSSALAKTNNYGVYTWVDAPDDTTFTAFLNFPRLTVRPIQSSSRCRIGGYPRRDARVTRVVTTSRTSRMI
jgi:hypothetical protein